VLGTAIRYHYLLLADQSASVEKSCQVETFDVSDSTQTIDAVFVVCEYERYQDSGPTTNLLFTTQVGDGDGTNLSQLTGIHTLHGIRLSLN
jgi:hypothetical protein